MAERTPLLNYVDIYSGSIVSPDAEATPTILTVPVYTPGQSQNPEYFLHLVGEDTLSDLGIEPSKLIFRGSILQDRNRSALSGLRVQVYS